MDFETLDRQTAAADGPESALGGDDEGFQAEQVLTIAGGHFVHDSYSGFLPPLLPLLQDRLASNYALTGSLAIFAQIPSLLNPFIGYLADKVSVRYFIILAPGITATIMSSLGLASDYLTLALLLFASGISIATFHAPAPAMIGRLAGKRVGKGMSIFMASGELGRTVGPLVVTAAVSYYGLEGIWRLSFVGWAVSLVLFFRLRHVAARPDIQHGATVLQMMPKLRAVFPVLIWLMLGRVFMQVSLTTYLPIYMRDVRESSLWLGSSALSILEAAGFVGALTTGTVSDKIGRNRVLLILLGLAPLFMFAFINAPDWLVIPLLLGLGITTIAPTPVVLAVVQDHFPDNRALANGILLTFSFSIRALGIWSLGWMADGMGLPSAYLWSGIAGLFGLPAIRFLPGERKPDQGSRIG